jgi:hydrogenase-4 component B
MQLLLVALVVLVLGGIAAALSGKDAKVTSALGAGSVVLAAFLGIIPVIKVLASWRASSVLALRLPWSMPLSSFYIRLDPLSAFFLVPILFLSAAAALYAVHYLQHYTGRRGLGAAWLFFNFLVLGMVLTVLAYNAIVFLVAWELMAVSSFFLVVFEEEDPKSRQAGWTYLIASHAGTAFLLALFAILGSKTGSLDFDKFSELAVSFPALVNLCFCLALVGFGTKAGFIPMHIWLPEAHPAAPSHVSAVMSGVMIKTGIYGFLRVVLDLGLPPLWWGQLVIAIGVVSGVLGVLFALAEHDLKRLLAYHSVENIGIIALGLGCGLLGLSVGSAPLVLLGFAGGLLHVLNHALFKGLLFMGAGAVIQATGTRQIDLLGGALKKMPWTGTLFLIGAIAISGLPPLNGFVSELLIYLAAWRGLASSSVALVITVLSVIVALALIGGLAAACFTKAFGIVFLGEPRTEAAKNAHEAGALMKAGMLLPAAGCFFIGILAPATLYLIIPVLAHLGRPLGAADLLMLEGFSSSLAAISRMALVLIALVVVLGWVRVRLLSGRRVEETVTWDCGYAQPTARLEYTASSFAQPILGMFGKFMSIKEHRPAPFALFPQSASFHSHSNDTFRERIFVPLFKSAGWALSRLHWLQNGNVQFYVVYLMLTALVLIVFSL